MSKTKHSKRDKLVQQLAQRIGFETLETRRSDSLDFQSVAVWDVKAALEAAFEAGRTAGKAVRRPGGSY